MITLVLPFSPAWERRRDVSSFAYFSQGGVSLCLLDFGNDSHSMPSRSYCFSSLSSVPPGSVVEHSMCSSLHCFFPASSPLRAFRPPFLCTRSRFLLDRYDSHLL